MAPHDEKTERAYAEELIAAVRTPLLVLDDKLCVLSVNRSFVTLFQTGTPGQASPVGQRLSGVRDTRWNVPGLDYVLETLLSTGDAVDDFEVTSRGRTILVNGRRVRVDPESDRIVLSFEDVTAQRQREAHLEARSAELSRDAVRKDAWIAMLGHEVRNPVSAIITALALLQSSSLPESARKAVGMLERQVEHLRRLLDDVLDAARIATGTLRIEPAVVDLAEVGRLAVEAVAGEMEERQHAFCVTLPPSGSLMIRGDAVRLTQLVTNLLTNAARFTLPGGRIALDISADEGGDATIEVSDTGIGIPRELMPHIFEILGQDPRSRSTRERGLGVGLPLVRRIAQLHGGEVEASSSGEGRGSTFRVALPRLEESTSGRERRAAKAMASRQVLPRQVDRR
jgi:signal transduction histidine kinase